MSMLSIKQLGYSVADKTLLDIAALELTEATTLALLGANGAGKSTLFKAMTDEIAATGDVYLHGKSIKEWSPQQKAKHLGVLPQSSQLTFAFTAHEVVALGLIPLTASHQEGERLVNKAMQQTDTEQFADRIYTMLSGGERQRVHLARVLVQLSQAEQAPLLLLDEPTSAQDLGQQHQILELAQSLVQEQGWSVIAILHDLNQALRYCDEVWLLEQGKLVDQGTPEQVLTPDRVHQVWGYLPQVMVSESGDRVLI